MNILWIYPELPFPLTSGYLRGYHLLANLGKRHNITFLCLTSAAEIPQESLSVLSEHAQQLSIIPTWNAPVPRVLAALAARTSSGNRLVEAWRARAAVRSLRAEITERISHGTIDVILFCGREALRSLRGVELPIVVDCGDTNSTRLKQELAHTRGVRRLKLLYRYLQSRDLERRLVRRSPYRYFISARDRENLLGSSDRSPVVPQGVDSAFWQRHSPPADSHSIVFSGVMSYTPNADAACFLMGEIFPLVLSKLPDTSLLLVGRDPTPEMLTAARSNPNVTITGTVKDVRPYLEGSSVFVAPLRFASGVQNKVLEAMSMELPVVTTPVVAEGMRGDAAFPELVVAKSAPEIAAAIVRLLSDREERRRLAISGRSFVETHCTWARGADLLEELCWAAANGVPISRPIHDLQSKKYPI